MAGAINRKPDEYRVYLIGEFEENRSEPHKKAIGFGIGTANGTNVYKSRGISPRD